MTARRTPAEPEGFLVPLLAGLALLVAGAFLAGPALGSAEGADADPADRSDAGTWSLVRLLEADGFTVVVDRSSLRTPGDETLRVELDPWLSGRGERRLAGWVAAGGNAVLAFDRPAPLVALGARVSSRASLRPATAPLDPEGPWDDDELARWRPVDQPGPLLARVRRLSLGSALVVTSAGDMLPLASRDGQAAAALLPVGRGLAVVVGSTLPFRNRGLAEADNARLVLQLARSLAPDRRLVLAPPLGDLGAVGFAALAWATPGRRLATGQALLALLVLLASVGRRRRPVAPPARGARSRPAAYAEALAELLRSARATGPALGAHLDLFLLDAAPRFGSLAPEAPGPSPALDQAPPGRAAPLRALLLEIRTHAAAGRPPAWLAQSLAARLAAARKELNLP